MSSAEIRTLEPKAIWNNFENLNAVPRPSKKEERVIAFIEDFAKSLNLDFETDKVGNIVVRKPATDGMENRKAVVLQAHLDMVHQKNADTEFDFNTQGIQAYIDGDWVKAKGTTLGADNGMGVAAIMSVLESKDIPHPALEALFTIDEEAGMTGAHHLEPNKLKGEIMMNLDTEDDDELSIGCAGGIDTDISWAYNEEKAEGIALKIQVKGLFGGHSGMDIIYGRGNANKIMNRLLQGAHSHFAVRVCSIDGGSLRNAIPRESEAIVCLPEENKEAFVQYLEGMADLLVQEYATTDPNLDFSISDIQLPSNCMEVEAQEKLTLAIQACHDGIKRMSPDVENLVETSNSLARVLVSNGNVEVKCLTRSDREGAKMDMAYTVGAPFHLIGAKVVHSGSYPGWKLDPNAPMLKMMESLYKELYGENPKVMACHAGLECGLIGQHYPHLEMISFGPTIRNPHSPDEKVSISSVQKFWGYFLEALKRVPESV